MVTDLKLSIGTRCVKYLLFVFNLLFVITGIILLSVGLVINGVFHNYQHFLDNKFFSVPNLLIAIGAIIFFIAFFGCCGAVRENYCMIITFTSLLVLVFILELSGGISGYVLKSKAAELVENKMMASMKEYESPEVSYVWDKLQRDFKCCGTRNATDWVDILPKPVLPDSCCIPEPSVQGNTTCTLTTSTLHPQGCLNTFLIYVKAHAVQLGGAAIGIAFLQAMGIWFAVCLARSIRNNYKTV